MNDEFYQLYTEDIQNQTKIVSKAAAENILLHSHFFVLSCLVLSCPVLVFCISPSRGRDTKPDKCGNQEVDNIKRERLKSKTRQEETKISKSRSRTSRY